MQSHIVVHGYAAEGAGLDMGECTRFDPVTGSDDVLGVGKQAGVAGLSTGGGLVLTIENGFTLHDPRTGNMSSGPRSPSTL